MKAILMSIQPKWCKLIASGKKTIEVRKTAPKETPFKVYMYETKGKASLLQVFKKGEPLFMDDPDECIYNGDTPLFIKGDCIGKGKVIAEYVCERIEKYFADFNEYGDYEIDDDSIIETCLTRKQLWEYGKGKTLRGLHISAVKIYDTPKELSEFVTVKCTHKTGSCSDCEIKPNCIKQITRPPQGWQYVEELK